ncbi:hypothetical protein BJ742DRAFT_777607 [Cladochytrium replicatum]|nr:hypothetical protein BJ742DRAFT_777607 [Cladochytrium replicatum]
MFSHLLNLVTSRQVVHAETPMYPSFVLILEVPFSTNSTTTYVLHIVPESGAEERISITHTNSPTFRYGHGKERSREQLGTISVCVADYYDTQADFFKEVGAQATLSLKADTGEEDRAQSVGNALRSTAVESLRKLEGRDNEKLAKGIRFECPVFLVDVDRSKPGELDNEMCCGTVSGWKY